MPKWDVYWTDEIAERNSAALSRARENSNRPSIAFVPGGPDHAAVMADRLVIEGGALIFYRDGDVDVIFGPTVYKQVYRRE
jgi:hypothetical protein